MSSNKVFLVGGFLILVALAGCIGGDDTEIDTGDDGDEGPTDGTGIVSGVILTVNLDAVQSATVMIVEGNDIVKQTDTDDRGRYELRNIEPGQYRLQVTAPCCHGNAVAIQVTAGETTQRDLQLEPFTRGDLQEPFTEVYEWRGFLACGYVLVVLAGDACSEVDEDSDRTHSFEIQPGLKTLTAALIWNPVGVLGEELQYGLAQDPCDGTTCTTPTDYYGFTVGTSPLELRIDGGNNQNFEDIEEPADVQLRVFPPFDSNVDLFYQQEFTVHYQLHYHQPAPEDYNPVPDG